MVDSRLPDENRGDKKALEPSRPNPVKVALSDFELAGINTKQLAQRPGQYLHYEVLGKREDGSDRIAYLKVVGNEPSSNNAIVLEYEVGAKTVAPEEKGKNWRITCDESIAYKVRGNFYKSLFNTILGTVEKTNGKYPNTGWNINLALDSDIKDHSEESIWYKNDTVGGTYYSFSDRSVNIAPNLIFLNKFDKDKTVNWWANIEKILFRKFFSGRLLQNSFDKIKAHFKLVYYSGSHNHTPQYVEDRANEFLKEIEYRIDRYFMEPDKLRSVDLGVMDRVAKGTFGLIPKGLNEEELKRAKEIALEAREMGQKSEFFDELLTMQPKLTNSTDVSRQPEVRNKVFKGALDVIKVAGAIALAPIAIPTALLIGAGERAIEEEKAGKSKVADKLSEYTKSSGGSDVTQSSGDDILDAMFYDQAHFCDDTVHTNSGSNTAYISDNGVVSNSSMKRIGSREADGAILNESSDYVGIVDQDKYVLRKDGKTIGRIGDDGFFDKF